ncbi:hypothetical protein MJO28_003048 [Puccinia striiformis f. sp. tritici]|nr:hypothetical protein MJO28_003048 [Puccinia striiformis f. sp. tritici]KAI7965026.1 hypothetical protein MJO29_003124 [Puccinia striiformis f. sp. tritici]KAI9621794.1 hypothetical protein H4Q26_015560 [Puccinia striiformis f. sp. tritici PST-130]
MSKTVVGPVPVEMGPMEKKLVAYLNNEIKKLGAMTDKISLLTNPETLLELPTQIKYLRDKNLTFVESHTELCLAFEQLNLEFLPRLMQEANLAIANNQGKIAKLHKTLKTQPNKDINPVCKRLDHLQDNLLSSIRQDLITEVRVYNQQETRNLASMMDKKFDLLFVKLDNIKSKPQVDLPVLNQDLDTIKRDISYLRENTSHHLASSDHQTFFLPDGAI